MGGIEYRVGQQGAFESKRWRTTGLFARLFDSTFRVSGLLPTWPVNSASISVQHCQQCQGQNQMGDVRIDTLPEITFSLQKKEVTEENNDAVNSWHRVERRH